MKTPTSGELLTYGTTTITRDGAPISIPPGWYAGEWSGDTVTIPAREGSPLLLTTLAGVRGWQQVLVQVTDTGITGIGICIWERVEISTPDVLPQWVG